MNNNQKLNNSQKLVEIGKIVKTNGIKGICYAFFYIDHENSLSKYKNFYNKNGSKLLFLIHSKANSKNNNQNSNQKKFKFLIKIKNVNSIDDAMKYIDQSIYVDLNENRESLADNEFFMNDLIGLNVYIKSANDSNDSVHVANIIAFHDFNAGTIIEILPLENYKSFFGAHLFFPFTEKYFEDISIENNKITLNLDEFL
jgi:16S rRNA processing protein RimM